MFSDRLYLEKIFLFLKRNKKIIMLNNDTTIPGIKSGGIYFNSIL
jgi:hypothetical protein